MDAETARAVALKIVDEYNAGFVWSSSARNVKRPELVNAIESALQAAVAGERERWQREAIDAIPTCSTDGDDYRMAKLAARGWRVLANRVYGELMNLRDQVLRYRVPADPKYIDALNRIDTLIREHDAAIRREGAGG